MIKVTSRTQEGVFWAICGSLGYANKGSVYFIGNIVNGSGSDVPSQWIKTLEDWKIVRIEGA